MMPSCLDRAITVVVEVKKEKLYLSGASHVGAALISALSQPSGIPCLLLDVGGKLWCHL